MLLGIRGEGGNDRITIGDDFLRGHAGLDDLDGEEGDDRLKQDRGSEPIEAFVSR